MNQFNESKIMNFRSMALILSIAFICVSCVHKNAGEVNISELEKHKAEYGVVVFRSMFFANDALVEEFIADNNFLKLSYSYNVSSYARSFSNNQGHWLQGYQVAGSTDLKEKARFIKQKRESGFFKVVSEIVSPEYFYTVTMLPKGEYYLRRATFNYSGSGSYLEQSFDAKDSPFAFIVEPGSINYIGDLYYMSPKSASFWMSTYNVDMLLVNDGARAKKFMENYHPEIKLPFTINLLKKNK